MLRFFDACAWEQFLFACKAVALDARFYLNETVVTAGPPTPVLAAPAVRPCLMPLTYSGFGIERQLDADNSFGACSVLGLDSKVYLFLMAANNTSLVALPS